MSSKMLHQSKPSLDVTSSTSKKTFQNSSMLMTLANRSGHRDTIYGVMRDPSLLNKDVIRNQKNPVFPFIQGSIYKGEWKNDMKDGFGKEKSPDGSMYSGQWKADKYDGQGTYWVTRDKKLHRQYVGEWMNGFMHGVGTYFYANGDEYNGDWMHDYRSGHGKHTFFNGDYYVGEWDLDKENGFGTLYFKNGNIYQGSWLDGKKEGVGKYFYYSTNKVYEGEWVNNHPKCGEFRNPHSEEEEVFNRTAGNIPKNNFNLPNLGLEDPATILEVSVSEARALNAIRRDVSVITIDNEYIDRARQAFNIIDKQNTGTISIHAAEEIFYILGVNMSEITIRDILQQVNLDHKIQLKFHEIVDIAIVCTSSNSSL